MLLAEVCMCVWQGWILSSFYFQGASLTWRLGLLANHFYFVYRIIAKAQESVPSDAEEIASVNLNRNKESKVVSVSADRLQPTHNKGKLPTEKVTITIQDNSSYSKVINLQSIKCRVQDLRNFL